MCRQQIVFTGFVGDIYPVFWLVWIKTRVYVRFWVAAGVVRVQPALLPVWLAFLPFVSDGVRDALGWEPRAPRSAGVRVGQGDLGSLYLEQQTMVRWVVGRTLRLKGSSPEGGSCASCFSRHRYSLVRLLNPSALRCWVRGRCSTRKWYLSSVLIHHPSSA